MGQSTRCPAGAVTAACAHRPAGAVLGANGLRCAIHVLRLRQSVEEHDLLRPGPSWAMCPAPAGEERQQQGAAQQRGTPAPSDASLSPTERLVDMGRFVIAMAKKGREQSDL
jgi:hypothetical protein